MPTHGPLQKGEPVSPPGEQIRRRIERLVFQANRTAKSPGPDAVHDLRVAIRRAEQALATFKPHLPRKLVKRFRKQLKPILSSAGLVRNYDIAVKTLLRFDQPEAAELRRELRARRKTAERPLLSGLRRLSLRTRVSRWCDDLKLNAMDFEAEMPTLTRNTALRLAQRFFEAGESAASHNSVDKLHQFRIRAKKLRYTLELFVPVYGPPVEQCIAEIKSVQSILGAMNDYRTVLQMAMDFGCGKKLKASLKRSERRKIRQFREIWAERFSGSVAAEWKRVLGVPAEPRRIPRKPLASNLAPLQPSIAAGA